MSLGVSGEKYEYETSVTTITGTVTTRSTPRMRIASGQPPR